MEKALPIISIIVSITLSLAGVFWIIAKGRKDTTLHVSGIFTTFHY